MSKDFVVSEKELGILLDCLKHHDSIVTMIEQMKRMNPVKIIHNLQERNRELTVNLSRAEAVIKEASRLNKLTHKARALSNDDFYLQFFTFSIERGDVKHRTVGIC